MVLDIFQLWFSWSLDKTKLRCRMRLAEEEKGEILEKVLFVSDDPIEVIGLDDVETNTKKKIRTLFGEVIENQNTRATSSIMVRCDSSSLSFFIQTFLYI